PSVALKQSGSNPHDPSISMWIGPLILATLGLAFGLMPSWIQDILSACATAVQDEVVELQLSLWHGVTPMLTLSVVTLAIGVGTYLCWRRIQRRLRHVRFIDDWGPDALYDRVLNALVRFSTWQTGLIQTGSLRHYMAMSVGIVATVVLIAMALSDGMALP